jgi:ABC-type branched-subunit amino acid transport system substrate-binding protein
VERLDPRTRARWTSGGGRFVPLAMAVVIAAGVVAGTGVSAAATSSATAAGIAALNKASTSSRGVSSTTINVVFPVSNLTTLSSNFGFAGDAEFAAQKKAIQTYVKAANAHGGINGRKINPMIVNFDPTNEAQMRALCLQWTKGTPAVFAVVDGLGSWAGDNQLCITQEGHTPFIAQWTTTTNWTKEGAPYLWWTGPDQASVLDTLVAWAKSAKLVGGTKKLGIVAGDRASDQKALNTYLLPDLRRAGITNAMVETIPADLSDAASTGSAAPLIVQHLQSAGVTAVIPLMPFNAMLPYIQAEAQQQYYPKLLLSDYEGSIESSLGLIPTYNKELNGQEGVTVETLGGTDANIPVSLGGYDPGVKKCYEGWVAAGNKPVSPKTSKYIEEQGPIAAWCQGVELFTEAATKAGRNLTRRSFVKAMASISSYQGTFSPTLSFGPGKYAGPTQYQVVQIWNNVPPSKKCVLTYKKKPQGTCWHVIQSWKPLVTS